MFTIRNGLKQGDALSPLLFNFALEYTIRIQVNQDGFKLTHQLLVQADDFYILVGSVHTIKETTEALVLASKDTGLEVTDKTKCMVMSQYQNAGQSNSMKTDNSSFERVED